MRKDVQINYEKILGNDDFNKKFTSRKKNKNISDNNSKLISVSKSNYALINSYNELYINDSVISDKYSSLDNAFNINPEIKYEEKNISKKISEYEIESEYLKNLPNNKYLNMQFKQWR